MDSDIYLEIWYIENYQKPRQARRGKTRQDKMSRHPDKKVSPNFENTVLV